jgi:uncharacterized protein YjbI with pentapeptide repeats
MTDSKPPEQRDEQGQEKWYERARYQVLLFAGGVTLFGIVLWGVMDWYIDPQSSGQKQDLVQALGLITAGVAGAFGIYFTWRGQRQTQEAQEENQRSTQEQLTLSRQGQITERFTRAIEQLGSNELDIRLGGIYALERIARESDEDHWPIMELLTAYFRRRAQLPPGEEIERILELRVSRENIPPPASDIEAITTVIRRRARSFGHGEPEVLNLGETNLIAADLRGANLTAADLRRAVLVKADLTPADRVKADLTTADLTATDFRGMVLMGADPTAVDRVKADLRGANLSDADLRGANLFHADLSKAGLSYADLRGANFAEADLRGADLFHADLRSATLFRADLRGASLGGANLSYADLTKASLSGARLSGADLSEAQDLTQVQIEEALGDKRTILPSDLKRPAHWEED